MVSEFFRRAGWDTDMEAQSSQASLVAAVRGKVYDIVGISMACDTGLPVLTETLRELRGASLNPVMRVIVGGPAFGRDPCLATQVGADGTASDARAAVGVAEDLLKEIQSGISLQPRMAFSWNILLAPN
jgi:methanogenic corrinoid protein MtbC1